MTAYSDLMAFVRDTQALGQISGRLGWDQETMMPKGAAAQRGEEMAALEKVLHARRTDPRIGEWLSDISPDGPVETAQIREITRTYERTLKVPADLAATLAKVTSEAQGIWAQARADEHVSAFLPILKEVVSLRREEAGALAQGGDLYDALLQDYEPGMTGEALDRMFGEMRPALVALREAALAQPASDKLTGTFAPELQHKLSAELATTFGYDLDHGRIDVAVHPFSSGSGLDVRITTRTNPEDPFNCFYSTIHEVGHAAYEQNINRDYLLTPLGQGVSMGVHESQSRIYENQLGRSRAFTGWLYGRMRDVFGDFGIKDEDAFYAAVNAVHRGYIRTEADEIQYNLHIMLRLELERALMEGNIQVDDLEAAWNDRFEADFGYAVDKPSNGLLQDVHWSVGLFGYFPTYSIGNVYAGCLHEALRRDVPDLDDYLAKGDTTPATNWLRDNVQTHGGLYEPAEVIAKASRQEPTSSPLIAYLNTKFGEIYGL